MEFSDFFFLSIFSSLEDDVKIEIHDAEWIKPFSTHDTHCRGANSIFYNLHLKSVKKTVAFFIA